MAWRAWPRAGRTLAVGTALALLVLWAVGLRASDLGRNYLEANEGGTFFLSMATLDKYLVWGGTESDFTGAEAEWNGFLAYYGLFHPAQQWLGLDEFSLRFIPMVCGALGVVALFFLGRRLGGDALGLMAALCLTLNCEHAELSRYYRFNSLSVLMTIVSTHLLLVALDRRSRLGWGAYLLSVVLSVWSMALSVFVLPAHWLYIWARQEDAVKRRRLLGLGVAVTCLALLPSRCFDADALSRISWYPQLSWDRWAEFWGALTNLWPRLDALSVAAYLAVYACLLVGLYGAGHILLQAIFTLAQRRDWWAIVAGWSGWRACGWLAGAALLVLTLGASVWDVFGHDTTSMYDRGISAALGGLFSAENFSQWRQRAGAGGLILLELTCLHACLGAVPAALWSRWARKKRRLSWQEIAAWGKCSHYGPGLELVWLWLVLPLTAMSLYTILVQPIMLTRNICFVIPAVALLIGFGFSRLNGGGKAAVLLALWLAWPALSYAQGSGLDPVPQVLDGWSQVVEVIQREARNGDRLVLKSVNGPSYRYYVYMASRYLRFPAVKVWPEFAWNGSPCPRQAFPRGREFLAQIAPDQHLWVIHDEPWFNILRLSDEDLRGFKAEQRWNFGFGMQLTKLVRVGE